MKAPSLTVLMAVYNGMPYLPHALEAVFRQSYEDFEFLIVDDCSSDDTADILRQAGDSRIRVSRNAENLNQTRSLNRGLELARGELIIRIDADDSSHSERFKTQLDCIISDPNLGMVGCDWNCIDSEGRLIGGGERPVTDLALRWTQFFTAPIGGNAIYRRSLVWEKLGGYNEHIRIPQDWELCSRVLPATVVASIAEKLYDLRVHPGQSSVTQKQRATEEARIVLEASVNNLLDSGMVSALASDRRQNLSAPRNSAPWKLRRLLDLANLFAYRYPAAFENEEIRSDLAARYLKLALRSRNLADFPVALRSILASRKVSGTALQSLFAYFRSFVTPSHA